MLTASDHFLTFDEFVKHIRELEGIDIFEHVPSEMIADVHACQLFPKYRTRYAEIYPGRTVEDMIRDRIIPAVITMIRVPDFRKVLFSNAEGNA